MSTLIRWKAASAWDDAFEARKWVPEIPWIRFPAHWRVKILPSHTGSVCRFLVETAGDAISVYLDCYDQLGNFGQPYWEAYPIDSDTARVAMNDVDGLIAIIEKELTRPQEV